MLSNEKKFPSCDTSPPIALQADKKSQLEDQPIEILKKINKTKQNKNDTAAITDYNCQNLSIETICIPHIFWLEELLWRTLETLSLFCILSTEYHEQTQSNIHCKWRSKENTLMTSHQYMQNPKNINIFYVQGQAQSGTL